MRFSASRLKTWMNCSLQAHYKYDEHLPTEPNAKTIFGSIIHRCLELYNTTGNYELAVETFKDLWHNPDKVGAPVNMRWPKFTSYASLRERGLSILEDFHGRQKWEGREMLVAEHRFLVPFGRHELTGVVDLLETRRSGKGHTLLRVVDYKTSSRAPTVAELALDIQFTVYLYASQQREFWTGNGPEFPGLVNGEWLFETMADMPRRAIWYHLWSQKEIDAGGRDDEDFFRLYRLCDEIERATEHEVFVPKIGEACGLCDFRNGPCPVRVPTRDELAADEHAWL